MSTVRLPRIALDFSTLDHAGMGSGQYRYAIDLIRGLVALRPNMQFLLIGSQPAPPAPLEDVFSGVAGGWTYRQLALPKCRGGEYARHLVLSGFLFRQQVSLLHVLHTFIPLCCRCPIVVTKYDLMEEMFPEYLAWRQSRPYRIHRWGLRHRARRVICISATTAEDLYRLWGVSRDRIDVVPLGTAFTTVQASAPPFQDRVLDLATKRPMKVLLSPYNLEPRKNLAALLQAVALLRPRHPELKLILFGRAAVTSEREGQFEQHLEELDIGAAVHRVGYVTDEHLAWLYRHTSIFVFPTLYEGFGLPLLEAMAAGACVLTRNASAMAEVVGDAGALVETRDPNQLAGMIESLLQNPDRCAQLRAAARRRPAAFTIESMTRLTLQSYLKALGHPRRTRGV